MRFLIKRDVFIVVFTFEIVKGVSECIKLLKLYE